MIDQDTMNDSQECISAMLRQEDMHYVCPDYLAADYIAQSTAPLLVVEECANLVTDLRLAEPVAASAPRDPIRRSLWSPSSTAVDSFVSRACSKSVTPDMDQSHLCPWRKQMCTWAYTAVDTFGLHRELVAVAFDILDRYLAKESFSEVTISREDFQLFSMTALYTAVKILEPCRKLSIAALIDMSRGYYSGEDIAETEVEMLQALQWRVNPPTAMAFVRLFLESVPDTKGLIVSCEGMVETAVGDSWFVPRKASSLALGAIMVAAREDGRDEVLNQVQDWMELFLIDSIEVTSVVLRLEN